MLYDVAGSVPLPSIRAEPVEGWFLCSVREARIRTLSGWLDLSAEPVTEKETLTMRKETTGGKVDLDTVGAALLPVQAPPISRDMNGSTVSETHGVAALGVIGDVIRLLTGGIE